MLLGLGSARTTAADGTSGGGGVTTAPDGIVLVAGTGIGSAACRFQTTTPTVPASAKTRSAPTAAAIAPPLGPVPLTADATDEPPVVPAIGGGGPKPGDDPLANPAPVLTIGSPVRTPSTRPMRSADAREEDDPNGASAAASCATFANRRLRSFSSAPRTTASS